MLPDRPDIPQILTSAATVAALHEAKPHLPYVDAFARQLRELFLIERTQFISVSKEEAYGSAEFAGFHANRAGAFVHVYFPWNEHLVKCVTADDYFALKTNRNQDLITAKQQAVLADYKVAVLGMSVGSNIAFVLTQAGISRKITLADLDALDTTNLNRILAGVHQVGINKAIVAARHIYEDNPFADVSLMLDGVTEQNLAELLENEECNCIVDEIDDIALKIKLRLLAMEHRVPVVMITDNGDGVVLHVERYDLGHDKIFGKTIEHFTPKLEGPMTRDKAGQIIIFDIVGGPQKVDPKMMASVKRVLDRELVSWSQLGSAAVLGAVISTIVIKRIALGESTEKDIRIHVNPFDVQVGTHAA